MAKVKKKNEDKFHLICPRCGSLDVGNDLSKEMIAWDGSTRYLCRECDYSSPFFPEVSKKSISEFRENLKTRTTEQKEIVETYSKSKGFLNKKINFVFSIGHLGAIATLAIISLGLLIFNASYLIYEPIFIVIILTLCITGFAFLLSKKIFNS